MQEKQLSSSILTWKRKLFFASAILFFSGILLEMGTRAVFALQVGPRVLLYGTSYFRNTISSQPEDDKRPLLENHTVMVHGNSRGGYTKYFPNETKIDHDAVTGEVFSVTINSRGFRGREFTKEKLPGVIRVVTLGASSTFGYYDRDDETYPYYLEQLLNQEARGAASFEVINLGIPHLRSDQILSLFRAEALPLNPDVVTFYEGINESAAIEKAESDETAGSATSSWKKTAGFSWLRNIYGGLRDRLITLAFLDSFRTRSADFVTYTGAFLQEHLEAKREQFLNNIAALLSESRDRGIVLVLANQQAQSLSIEKLAGITYAQEVEIIQEKLRREGHVNFAELAFLTHSVLESDLKQWALSNEVPFVDVVEVLDREREVLLSHVHLSPRGNQMVAEAFASEIRQALSSR